LPLIGLIAGCTTFRVAGDVETGRTQLLVGNPESALPYFQQATESDVAYGEAWAQMGFCSEKLGRHADAIEASKKAVNIRPSAESYFNIGLANYYLKQYRESEAAYRQSIKIDPYNAADSYYALGLTYRDSGQFEEEV